MSRRKIESLPSVVLNEELRQIDSQSERKSVFERLGRIKRTIDRTVDVRRVVSRNDYEETDLRFKVRRKRTNACLSPNRSVSPQTQTSAKTSTHSRSVDKFDNKVKSLVLAPNRRSESPTTHTQSVTSSSNSSSVKRSTLSVNKWEDDIDDDVLERKRLQLQKELQELEISGSLENQEKSDCLPLTVTVSHIRSRSSSAFSTESGSCSSSIKSFSKTESSCSSNAEKNSNNKSSNRDRVSSNKSISSEKKIHVSSSISRKTSNLDDSSHKCNKKSSEVKFDRHGNIRISLDEQERQKRLRAERFADKHSMSQIDVSKKKSSLDPNSIEPKSNTSRDRSHSPSTKRSRESVSNEKSNSEKNRETSEAVKVERNDENRRDDYKNKSDSRTSKYESSPRSRSSETESHKPKHKDNRNKGSERSRRSSLLSGSPNYCERRDHSRDSRFSDRDNTSVTSRHDQRRGQTYSRDQSPTHSTHSKFSRDRDSSIGSDFSRSKSERLSIQSHDRSTHSQNIELKNIEVKVSDPIIEEMSPISADSSIPDVMEIDSPKLQSKVSVEKEEESLISNRFRAKTGDESDDDFSDWSEGEDELLLKNDGFETLDEIGNISETSQEKDSWNEEKSNIKSKANSGDCYLNYSKDDALEAISDDEFDAIIGESEPIDSNIDSKKSSSSRQMLDSLEIDWGSLVSEPKTKLEYISGSARKRFTPANVLMRIGFSQTFAGPLMTQKIIDFCQNELKEDFVPFRHPMAAVHSLISERIKERRYLFGFDTNSNALSGRKDLQIRKMLNKSSFKIFDNSLTTTTISVNDLSVLSTNDTESIPTNIQCF